MIPGNIYWLPERHPRHHPRPENQIDNVVIHIDAYPWPNKNLWRFFGCKTAYERIGKDDPLYDNFRMKSYKRVGICKFKKTEGELIYLGKTSFDVLELLEMHRSDDDEIRELVQDIIFETLKQHCNEYNSQRERS